MPTTKKLTGDNVNLDDEREMNQFLEQVIAEGMERVHSDVAELGARGIVDENGRFLKSELPPDMREGSDRDFGG